MKKELLSMENGRYNEGNNPIFSGLYLRINMSEIAGIICDDIKVKQCLNDFLLGKLELESGKIFINENLTQSRKAAQVLSGIASLVERKSKLIDNLAIEENIFLFNDKSFFIGKKAYKKRFYALLQKFGISLCNWKKPSDITPKDRVMVEIMRAYVEGKSLVILDDLYGFLQKAEIDEIFSVLSKMMLNGMTFLIIIGFEDEYMQKISRITAIRNGKTVSLIEGQNNDNQTVTRRLYFNENTIKLNIRRKFITFHNKQSCPIMAFQNVSTSILQNINFTVKPGELLKIYCSDESNCQETADLIKGEIKPLSGEIFLNGERYKVKNIYDAIRQGVCFIEKRAYSSMIFRNLSVVENLGITCGEKVKHFWLYSKYSDSIVKQLKNRFGKVTLNGPTKFLNSRTLLQIAYYKWILYFPKLIVIDNPFSDLDIYMREKVIDMIHQYLEMGIAVLIITSNVYTAEKFDGRTIYILRGKQVD